MLEKRGLYNSQGKVLLQNLAEKNALSIYAGIIKKYKNKNYKCVTETWVRENFDDRVKEWFPLKNGNSTVKLENDKGVDGYDKAKSINTMPCFLSSFILSRTKRLMNIVNKQVGGFYKNSVY